LGSVATPSESVASPQLLVGYVFQQQPGDGLWSRQTRRKFVVCWFAVLWEKNKKIVPGGIGKLDCLSNMPLVPWRIHPPLHPRRRYRVDTKRCWYFGTSSNPSIPSLAPAPTYYNNTTAWMKVVRGEQSCVALNQTTRSAFQ
jgi:hypothetical protein